MINIDSSSYLSYNNRQALPGLQVAEELVAYLPNTKENSKSVVASLVKVFKSFPLIQKAWIFGSFAQKKERRESDIDLAIQTEPGFSYFDLADVQHQLEDAAYTKIDLGFIGSLKPVMLKNIQSDLTLLYERPS